MESLRKLPFGHIMNFIGAVSASLVMMYTFTGPIVKPLAAEAFVDMLKAQGVDPEVFKKLKEQSVVTSNRVNEVSKNVDTLANQMDDLDDTLKVQNQSVNKVEQKLDKLIEILINKRADFTPSPPGTGPVSPLNLGAP